MVEQRAHVPELRERIRRRKFVRLSAGGCEIRTASPPGFCSSAPDLPGAVPPFTLAGIASLDGEGNRRDIYVHAKVMLIDDEWATIGSCNLHSNSLSGHTEMNASIWDTAVVRPLRYALLAEHLDLNTTNLNARAALQQFRSTSLDNRRRRAWLLLAELWPTTREQRC